jgi:hypothetical protein
MVLAERDGALHAAQDMGHFGVKMKRSRDGGARGKSGPCRRIPRSPRTSSTSTRCATRRSRGTS